MRDIVYAIINKNYRIIDILYLRKNLNGKVYVLYIVHSVRRLICCKAIGLANFIWNYIHNYFNKYLLTRERDAWRDQVNIRVRSVNFTEVWWLLVLRAKL